jgi:hypothetical protein
MSATIKNVLALENSLRLQRQLVAQLELRLGYEADSEFTDLQTQLADERMHLTRLDAAVRRKRVQLGLEGRQNLQRLQDSRYLQVRLEALALKTRIRERVRQRKFELERLERAYRQAIHGKDSIDMCCAM